ncbi:hypothetical protein [Pararhodonellum marinum]|uniref:hypothetical protein n=1 Tax=Pararhodonellum marinum TaxID=2755358 RepID=UPI00189094BE|nr:hypothetical protein [Pararhodonellum marinum]
MKQAIFSTLAFLISICLHAQDLSGAWKLTHQDGQAVGDREVIKTYQDGYFAFGAKTASKNEFLNAGGGEYALEGTQYTETYDFNASSKDKVGQSYTYNLDMVEGKMVLSLETSGQTKVEIWEQVSDQKDELTGNWVITGRKRGDEISSMTPGARRTVKILSGGRFQWIAFNSETKEFSGTGGGSYTAENGKYTEQIEFFSRDNDRVGDSLEFDFEVKEGKWHHSGLSSKGDPIYEVWSKYQEAYSKPQ